MALPSEDDREAIDRAFAELVAGYHLTAERPDPPRGPAATDQAAASEPVAPQLRRRSTTDRHPVRAGDPPRSSAPGGGACGASPRWSVQTEERYVPEPLPPLRRPGVPALLGWIGIALRDPHRARRDLRGALPDLGRLDRRRRLRRRLRHPDDPAAPRATAGAGDGAVL